jgi:hypothetical protein
MMAKKNASPMDVLIENIQADQKLLQEHNILIDETKDAKREVVDRIRDARKDLTVFLKYATEEQKEKVEALGFEFSDSDQGLNTVSQMVIDIMTEKKKLSNGDIYKAYVEALPEGTEAENYTQFNIKMRSCFNRQLLTRQKAEGAKNSREDMISLVVTTK